MRERKILGYMLSTAVYIAADIFFFSGYHEPARLCMKALIFFGLLIFAGLY